MEETVKQLLLEGYTSKEIREALMLIVEDAKKQEQVEGSLDNYLDSLEDDKG